MVQKKRIIFVFLYNGIKTNFVASMTISEKDVFLCLEQIDAYPKNKGYGSKLISLLTGNKLEYVVGYCYRDKPIIGSMLSNNLQKFYIKNGFDICYHKSDKRLTLLQRNIFNYESAIISLYTYYKK